MRQQHEKVKNFVDVSGGDITTNSSGCMSMLKAEGVLRCTHIDGEGFPKGKTAEGTRAKTLKTLNRGMRRQ
jgi:hypothetical protein